MSSDLRDASQLHVTMLRELNHRAKNVLQLIASVLTLEKSNIEDRQARQAITKASQRLQMLAELYSVLYLVKNDSDRVQMKPYLEQLCEALMQSVWLAPERVRVNVTADDVSWPVEKASELGMVVAEAVTNACKHAFEPNEHATITVRLSRKVDFTCELEISDDGKGFDTSRAKPGVGTTLIGAFAQSLQANLEIESRPGAGTHVRISLPKNFPSA